MRLARACAFPIVVLCICLQVQAQTQTPSQKLTVTGKLTRVVAIGGESTGWAIDFDSELTIDGKDVHSVEVDYAQPKQLEELENKHVKAKGTLSHRHGVETGDWVVLDIASIKEAKAK